METTIVKVFDESREKVLCNIILERFLVGPLKRVDSDYLKRVIACASLFILSGLLLLFCLLVTRYPLKASTIIAVTSALISALSFYVISWNYEYIVDQVTKAFSGPDQALGTNLDKKLSAWVKKAVKPRYQLLGSIVSLTLIALILYVIVDIHQLSAEHFGKVLAIFIAVFSVGQGAYWAIVSPLFTRALSLGSLTELEHQEISGDAGSIDPLYPHQTPLLVAASRFLSVAAITDAFVVTLCLVGLFVVRPRFTQGSSLKYTIIILLVGYFLTTWNFLYPQLNLARIIRHAKKNTLSNIRAEANKLYSKLAGLSPSDFERLDHLMKLQDSLSKGPNTMINFPALRSLIGSLLTPTIVGIIGVIDWKSLLNQLPLSR